MNEKVKNAIEDIANVMGFEEFDDGYDFHKGQTLRKLFEMVEKATPHAFIGWGCWNDSELDAIL